MEDPEEMEPVDPEEAKEALKLLAAQGKLLWKTYEDDFGELFHWLNLSHTALEPLPEYQEEFRFKCGNKRRAPDERLSAAIHILDSALKMMTADQVNLKNPSASYRRLLESLPH
ncbi:MAG: hypothetical protein ACLP5H_22950 [Desulfomonilaceae bacterium]